MGGQRHAPAALSPGKPPGTHCIGGWVHPRAGLDGCRKSRPPTGIRSPDRPVRSELLYRLSYPEPQFNKKIRTNNTQRYCYSVLTAYLIIDLINTAGWRFLSQFVLCRKYTRIWLQISLPPPKKKPEATSKLLATWNKVNNVGPQISGATEQNLVAWETRRPHPCTPTFVPCSSGSELFPYIT